MVRPALGSGACGFDEAGRGMTNLTVRELKQAEWDRWDDWLALQPWGSPFSAAWWLDANCRAFGGHPLLLGVFDGEQLVGGVALRITDVGPVHVVRPSMLYNPIVIAVGSAQSRQKVLATLLEDMARRRLVVPSLACTTDMVDLRQAVWHHWNLMASWTVVITLKTWTLDDVSPAELNKMRKAQRAEVTAHVEPPDADVLYNLMKASMTRQGQETPLGREQLRILIEATGAHGMQTVVRGVDGVPLSAGFVMAHGTRIAYHIWSGTSPIGLTKGAAVAMYVGRLEQLQARGYEYLDCCGASLPGLSDFKLSFGGTLTTRLAISREPLWYKAARLVHVCLLWFKRVLRRH
ncbi:GNAT family N-acetyltransferase [Candidatus Cryosericum septentrionale]|uniref:GNAT family N-acetyltransferase n=2 Tax=Candidatus Cryosericum septentrionale TaxID=2290913 RepID=A0A398DXG9_9BACT|nr:GNAT family N-acetyltransferase [Candidatus Cryosericum septentrionale]